MALTLPPDRFEVRPEDGDGSEGKGGVEEEAEALFEARDQGARFFFWETARVGVGRMPVDTAQ